MTANGYHTLGEAIDRKAHPLAAGRSKAEFVEAYLAQHQEDELRILQNLAPHVRVCSRRLWVMTLVLKQDLWWAERLAVEAHYRDGAFGSELQRLADGRDARLFRAETVFASLVIRNFETATERLASNAAGYDAKEQSESVQRLRDTLSALKEWETET